MIRPTLYQRALRERYGLPDINWATVLGELDDTPESWAGFLDEWLTDLAERLEPESKLVHHGMIRCIYNERTCTKPLPKIASEIRNEVYTRLLSDPADFAWPTVIVHVGSQSRYYDYVSIGDPNDGEGIASSGCVLGRGYFHIAMNATPGWDIEPLLAHEFVHLALCGFPTPLWLEEGLAQLIPDVLLNRDSFSIDRELVSRHRAFWSNESIQSFWDGSAFGHPDSSELAYSLADILVRNIAIRHGQTLRAFTPVADEQDGGDSAAREHLGVGLADIVSEFLGDGDWEPWQPDRGSSLTQ